MAQEDDLDLDIEGGAEAPKSKSKMLIVIVVVVLLLGVSATATLMLTGILSGGDQPADVQSASDVKADKGAGNKLASSKPPLNYIPLDPPFVVNFSGDSDIRFLQITIEAGTRGSTAPLA